MLPFLKKTPQTGEIDLDTLRKKWGTVPGDVGQRLSTEELLRLNDTELCRLWSECADKDIGGNFAVRGWYHLLYWEFLHHKHILDIGSGFGIDGIRFAMRGNHVTFVDIVESNIEVLRRICRAYNLDVYFVYMENLSSLDVLPIKYDVVWAQGSLINAPFEHVKKERQILCDHLKIGGRWIELCYPKSRWIRDRKPPFSKWGEMTDGKGTPWVEWYDIPKMMKALEPNKFETVLYHEFYNGNFNWFDLLRYE